MINIEVVDKAGKNDIKCSGGSGGVDKWRLMNYRKKKKMEVDEVC